MKNLLLRLTIIELDFLCKKFIKAYVKKIRNSNVPLRTIMEKKEIPSLKATEFIKFIHNGGTVLVDCYNCDRIDEIYIDSILGPNGPSGTISQLVSAGWEKDEDGLLCPDCNTP